MFCALYNYTLDGWLQLEIENIEFNTGNVSDVVLNDFPSERKIDQLTQDNAISAYKTNAIGPTIVAKVQLSTEKFLNTFFSYN